MLPPCPGVGFKPQHFQALMDDPAPVAWLEIHAENYMGDGGRPLAQLAALAERFPISVHGVGLSIGGRGPLDRTHLARLKRLCDWINPASFSEHLAWSSHEGIWFNDLLPLPYTSQTLTRVADHVCETQDLLGRRMLLENPSSYLHLPESDWPEVDFLREISRRTGCGLLLDVNNVQVSATNLGFDPATYLATYPMDLIEEIHLGGHRSERDAQGHVLLIDSHSAPVADPVWRLYQATLAHGPRPTLIEWDNDIPDWPVLAAEAVRVSRMLAVT